MNVPRPTRPRRSPLGAVVAALIAAVLAVPTLLASPAAAAGSGVVNVEITPINLATGNPITDLGAGFAGNQVTYRVSYSCGTAACDATQIAFGAVAPAAANPVQAMPEESLLRYQSFVPPASGSVTASGDDVTGRVFTLGNLAPGTSANFSVTYAYAGVRNREIPPGAWYPDGSQIPMTATISSPTATAPVSDTAAFTWHVDVPADPTLSNPAFGTVEPDVPLTMSFGMNLGNFTSSNGIPQGIGTVNAVGSYEVVAHLPAEATITSAELGGVIDNVAHTVTWTAGTPGAPSYAARGGWSTVTGNGTVGVNNGLVPGGDAFWQQRAVEVVFPASAFPEADADGCNFSKDLTTTLDVAVSYLDAATTGKTATRSGVTRVACATPFGGMPTPTKGVAGGGFQGSVGNGVADAVGGGIADDVYAVNVPPTGETDPANRDWRVVVQNTGNVAGTAVVAEPNLDQDFVKVNRISAFPDGNQAAGWAGTVDWVDNTGASGTSPISASQVVDAAAGRWFVSATTTFPIAPGRILRTDGTVSQVQLAHRFKVLDGAAAHIGERRSNTADVSISYPADADGDGIDDDYTDTLGDPLPSRSFAAQVSRTIQYTEPLGTLTPVVGGTVDGGGQLFPGTNVTFTARATTANVWPGTSIQPQLVFLAPVGWEVVPGSAAISAPGTGWANPGPAGVTFDYVTRTIAGVDRDIVVAAWPSTVGLSSTVNEQWPTLSVKATPTNTAPVGVNAVAHVWAGDDSGNWIDGTGNLFRRNPNEFNGENITADAADVDGDGNTTEEYAANFSGDGLIVAATDSVTAVKELCLPDPSAADGCQWVSDPAQPGEVQADATDITYRIRIVNSGNTTLTDVVAYDVLPHVGDTGLLPGGAPRGSQFALTLGGVDSTSAGVTVAGSASTNPARPEVNPGAPGTVNDWGPAAAGDAAIRITVDGGLAPAEERAVTFHATLPAGATAGQQACNSAAVDSGATLPAEPASVCVLLTAVPNPPPTVAIAAPTDGATYEFGEDVLADFGCTDVPDTDLVSCIGVDEDGTTVADGAAVDTDEEGTHTLTVTATDSAGQTDTETVTYTVNPRPNQPPTATITTPSTGAVYFRGQPVPAVYTCADPDGTIVSCTGNVPAGSNIDTTTVGSKTFTVTATDDDGATGTASVNYTVVAVSGVCRGTPLSLLGLMPGTANPRTSPCATDDERILGTSVTVTPAIPLLGIAANAVQVGVITGNTQSGVGSAAAQSQIASVKINLLGQSIVATGLTSSASSVLSSCGSPAALNALSTITALTINGKPVANLNGPVTVPLLIGSLKLNERIVSGNTITQNALHLNVLGLVDLVLGQSVAGASC